MSPPSPNIAPPGYYQLVLVDQAGVPSPGVIVGVGNVEEPAGARTVPMVAAAALATGGTGTGTGPTAGAGGGTGTGTGSGTGGSTGGTVTGTAGTAPTTAVSLESASNPGSFARRLYGDQMASASVTTAIDRLEAGFKVVTGFNGLSNGIGTGPRIGFQSGPHRERGVTPLVSPAERVGVAQPG